ncbi:MAG: MYXO-CTERM sorting domain-containing protein [Polyangiales bacterium]
MRVRLSSGLPSIVLLGLVAASGCTQPTGDATTGTARQAVVSGCHLATLGAACDPDGDGPLGACDGTCVAQGGPAGGAFCTTSSIAVNEGMPCGGLESDHVDCDTSCRRGVCTKRNADEGTECMPSGATLVSAICEGACHAGTCDKLYHPKRCYDPDAGTGDGATSGSGDGGTSGDGGVTSDDSGWTGGGDTGAGSDDTGGGTGEGDDTGTAGGDDTGATSDDTGGGTGEGDDTGGAGGGDTGTAGRGDTGSSAYADTGWSGGTPAADDAGANGNADTGTGDTGGCGCHTPGTSSTTTTSAVLAAVAIAFARLRRRRG